MARSVVGEQHWKPEPEEHDFPAAADFLALLLEGPDVERIVAALRKAATVHKKGKDLSRASRLPRLPPDNPHVAKDLKRVKEDQLLSPVLLVRGRLAHGIPLTVADGYHRICASYHLDEDADILCRIVDFGGP
jgi:hypothetical protein